MIHIKPIVIGWQYIRLIRILYIYIVLELAVILRIQANKSSRTYPGSNWATSSSSPASPIASSLCIKNAAKDRNPSDVDEQDPKLGIPMAPIIRRGNEGSGKLKRDSTVTWARKN